MANLPAPAERAQPPKSPPPPVIARGAVPRAKYRMPDDARSKPLTREEAAWVAAMVGGF